MREISRRSIDLLVLWNIRINASQKIQSGIYPLGVVGAIVSWNYPFHNLFNPILAVVFSGNGIVVKVSEHASWSGCFYVQILQTALAAIRAPENLVEVITGFAETGEALVSSVDKIIFVGSPGVGRMIMRKAADTLILVTLELGGKDPFIVCEDVDVAHVAQVVVRASLQSSVQNCAGAERLYVHKDIYASFVAAVVKIVKSVSAGPPQLGKYDMDAIYEEPVDPSVKVGRCSVDVLKQLSMDVVSLGIKNRMNKLTNHLLSRHRHVFKIQKIFFFFHFLNLIFLRL
uniref:Aldehyde dehydrogenase domain-containing protein n=1 Tax=Lactuca sativa TaxID=4236 RepID=A0A9R1W736_LACSA|nr:hypothetical protein LSAT_V11C300112890 [Lactuca sativa]